MPDLLDRVLGYLEPDESNLSISRDVIEATMDEFNRGEIPNQNAVKAALGLTDADLAGFTTVYLSIYGPTPTLSIEEFRSVTALGATRNRNDPSGAAYYSKAKVKTRLGL